MASCCFTRNKLPKVPTNLSVPRTRSAGHAQQVRAAARKKTQRAQPTFPPHRLARQGTPSRSGRQPAKGPKGPTNLSTPPTRPAGQTQQVRAAARKNPKGLTSLSTHPTRPAGHASQSSAGRSRRKRMESSFPRACTGEKIPLTPRVPAPPARFGVQPPILGGASHQAGNLTPPYSALPNEGKSQVPLPKFLTPRSSAPPPYPNPAASSER